MTSKTFWNDSYRIWDLVKIYWCPCSCCPVGTKLAGPGFSLIFHMYTSSDYRALTDWFLCGWGWSSPLPPWNDPSWPLFSTLLSLPGLMYVGRGSSIFINSFCLKSLLKEIHVLKNVYQNTNKYIYFILAIIQR